MWHRTGHPGNQLGRPIMFSSGQQQSDMMMMCCFESCTVVIAKITHKKHMPRNIYLVDFHENTGV